MQYWMSADYPGDEPYCSELTAALSAIPALLALAGSVWSFGLL
jgi:hypothetical protein